MEVETVAEVVVTAGEAAVRVRAAAETVAEVAVTAGEAVVRGWAAAETA